MNKKQIEEIFDEKIRIRLSFVALVSVSIFAGYIHILSPEVRPEQAILDQIFIAVLGVISTFCIGFYLQQLSNCEKTSRQLRKQLPDALMQFRLDVAEISGQLNYCESLLTHGFHHAMIQAEELLNQGNLILKELRRREDHVIELLEIDDSKALALAYIELNSEIEITHSCQTAVNSSEPVAPIQADMFKEHFEDLFLSFQSKLGIAEEDVQKATDSLSRAQLIDDSSSFEVANLETEDDDVDEDSWYKRRNQLVSSMKRYYN